MRAAIKNQTELSELNRVKLKRNQVAATDTQKI